VADGFAITIDGAAMREALQGESLKAEIKGFVKAASRISADHIADEAAARLARQLSGTSSGTTVAEIAVQSARDGWGWVVVSGNTRTPMLPRWLEAGTRHMKARSYFNSSALLEEAAHHERIAAAIQAALSVHGLAEGQG
jgi:hypothetical protein